MRDLKDIPNMYTKTLMAEQFPLHDSNLSPEPGDSEDEEESDEDNPLEPHGNLLNRARDGKES